jgi:malto-oligosyltrehalose trehalohydrolase
VTAAFHFRKSWGAEPVPDGTRFRLWAPSQERISVRLVDTNTELPMRRGEAGWFELETDTARPGASYAYVLSDGMAVNDPAARAQAGGANGPSLIVDPTAFEWHSANWKGKPLEELVVYELHTGAFSPEGTFDGVRRHLDHLVETGVTAIELMPVAQFGGERGWGYDGVLLYAPHSAYGGPDGLKRLVDECHLRGLMTILDVVYNHFGPDGNYLHLYAPDFFHPEHATPWGAAIAYEKQPVRDFFIENALFWLDEYRFDGLRFDAIDQIERQSDEPLLEEIGEAVRNRITDRPIHLTTEDDRNITRLHERDDNGRVRLYSAEWNDDVHHAFHVIATGEQDGYYQDYADDAVGHLARALATGFVQQGEMSRYRRGETRGMPSAHLPPTAFVNFLQNHDQIGNRAFNERLTALAEPQVVELLTAILLLSPQIPLLFMGEEWGETRPFRFFTDFHGELGDLVREGRRKEFSRWAAFASEENREKIADPNAESTFAESRLDWAKLGEPAHRARFEFVEDLLDVRRREIVPLVARIGGNAGAACRLDQKAFVVRWRTVEGGGLWLGANVGQQPVALDEDALGPSSTPGAVVFAHGCGAEDAFRSGRLSPRSVVVAVEEGPQFVPLPE